MFYYKGYVDYKDIFNVLSSFDVGLAHVSNQDNYWYQMITSMRAYPRKIIEYMAATLPILASNQIAHTKTFNDLPLFYKENDEADLRDKIIMLRDDEKLRKRKGSEGYEFFVNNYSLNVIGSKIRRVYKHLIDG